MTIDVCLNTGAGGDISSCVGARRRQLGDLLRWRGGAVVRISLCDW